MATNKKKVKGRSLVLNMEDVLKNLENESEFIHRSFEDVIEETIGLNYGPYSQERGLMDVKDGVIPVVRRIITVFYRNKNSYYNTKGVKCASIVGATLADYHPHGDAPIYGTLVNLGKHYSTMSPKLVEPKGNFGTIAGDPPAAYRYTEIKSSKFLYEVCLKYMAQEDIIDEKITALESTYEPCYLPTAMPLSLLYGGQGVAIGFRSAVPSHNINEVIDLTIKYIKNPSISVEELARGFYPDYVNGCEILNPKSAYELYTTGVGSIQSRARCRIVHREDEDAKKGERSFIEIKGLPDKVGYDTILTQIQKARDKDNIIIKKMGLNLPLLLNDGDNNLYWKWYCMDNSVTRRELESVVTELYKVTDLQTSMSYIFNFVEFDNYDHGSIPRVLLLNLKDVLEKWYSVRKEFYIRNLEYENIAAQKSLHINEGLLTIVEKRDKVVEIIRASQSKSEAMKALSQQFGLSEKQSLHIVEQELHTLTKLSRNNLIDKYDRNLEKIAEIEKGFSKITTNIIDSLYKLKRDFNTPRKSELIFNYTNDTSVSIMDGCILSTHNGYSCFDLSNIVNVKNLTNGMKSVRFDNVSTKEIINVEQISGELDSILIAYTDGNVRRIPLSDIKIFNSWINIDINDNVYIDKVIPIHKGDTHIMIVSNTCKIRCVDINEFTYNRISKFGIIKCIKSFNIGDVKKVLFMNNNGKYWLCDNIEDIPISGKTSLGVSTSFSEDDYIMSTFIHPTDGQKLSIYYTIGETGYSCVYNTSDLITSQRTHALKSLVNVTDVSNISIITNSSGVVLIGPTSVMKQKVNTSNIKLPKKIGIRCIGNIDY